MIVTLLYLHNEISPSDLMLIDTLGTRAGELRASALSFLEKAKTTTPRRSRYVTIPARMQVPRASESLIFLFARALTPPRGGDFVWRSGNSTEADGGDITWDADISVEATRR